MGPAVILPPSPHHAHAQLLSTVEKSGLLSKLEKSGLTLSKVGGWVGGSGYRLRGLGCGVAAGFGVWGGCVLLGTGCRLVC